MLHYVQVAAIPDESHWGTFFSRHKLPMWGHLLTFMMPGDPRTGHPRIFGSDDISLVLNETARLAAAHGEARRFLFARKFATTNAIDRALHHLITRGL